MAEPKVSPKMRKGIKVVETVLGIKYTGKSFDDAAKFLDEHLEKCKGVDMRDYMKPSEKMMNGIELIRRTLGVEFTGSTMKDASKFLDEYLPQASKVIESKKGGKTNGKSKRS